ncbi:unnamed protein product, partial [Phaeothamnion confervicola]
ERREVIRLQCRVTVQFVGDDASSHDVVVTNISLKGLRAETPRKFKKGDRVLVGMPNSRQGPVSCQVMWTRTISSSGSLSVGLKFDDTQENMARSWLKDTLRQLGFEPGKIRERRNFIRFPSPSQVRSALANRAGDFLGDGRLINIGFGGALAAVSVEVPVGTQVRVQLDPTLDTPPLDAAGVVRSNIRDTKRQLYITGIEFDMQGEGQIKKYIRAVKKKLAK